ncbi:MAG TPA: sulfotransferase domain-containing protein [Gaiellales bacterium]|nr:sulfotransferase domain-containing protein [Gaiellales bacterium]
MRGAPRSYASSEEDNGRWLTFPFRAGDIVISTRSKHGTTWMQMICALLVFRSPDLPAPLGELSPWVDRLTEPQADLFARLEAQCHRRFVKTHTPLGGLPIEPEVTYIVVARHPLDAAVSLYHQGDNIDRARLRELVGLSEPEAPAASRPTLHDWLVAWVEDDPAPWESLDSLPGVMWHVAHAWGRRFEPNVVLVHYEDLEHDLEGAMRALAGRLGTEIDEPAWPALVRAASFAEMSAHAESLLPDQNGILKDPAAFFRRGTSGAAREVLSGAELARYEERARELAPVELLAWLHRM